MKTAKEVQEYIFEHTGLKTSVRKGTGSMKGYLTIWPIFQNGAYPSFDRAVCDNLKQLLQSYDYAQKPLFCTSTDVSVYGIGEESISCQKERKPSLTNDSSPAKTWGSKNSQLRLDKAAARYAKKRRGANGNNMVKYW